MALLRFTDERPDEAIEDTINAVINDATTRWDPMEYEGEYPTTGFGIANLRPRHVNISVDYWGNTNLTGNTWTQWCNAKMNKDSFVIVTGIFNKEASPQVTQMYTQANGQDLPIVSVEELDTLDVARAWFPQPFYVKPDNKLVIQLYNKGSAKREQFGLLGYVVAKRAVLIDKTPTFS